MKLVMTLFAIHKLNQASISFTLLSSKQANNIYNFADEIALQKEKKKEYMNEYQVMLFDFMHSLPKPDDLKDELHKVVLASKVNSVEDFIKSKNVLFKIVMDIKEGVLTVTSTLRAVFVGAFSKAIERPILKHNLSKFIILNRRNTL
ncbi:hypothetical protein ACIQ7N_11345 [Lysinibacillus sp. NPDC095746]|uniref:hypothetical protein n=1 Tax=Lysinibacillus sp. NPDC095746 TaxID=3364134 RepID=UPI0037F688B0